MTKKQAIQLFEEQKVRTIWDDEQEKWYFCVVDVVEVLTDSANPQTYWRVLKNRLKKEGNETVTNCNALKLRAADGKMRMTDVADTEQLFLLIQSIPSINQNFIMSQNWSSRRNAFAPVGRTRLLIIYTQGDALG